jgi:hypothetical protein
VHLYQRRNAFIERIFAAERAHRPADVDHRTRNQRRAEKQAVVAERRAIKKAARQELKRKLRDELAGEPD